jgi:hypothetical protein
MTTDKKDRKERPIASGVLDYFPDAIAEVANVSFVGNQQHNPGQPMHWDRSKSGDHADCLARHLIERGTVDTDGVRHSAKAAWRALAMLQIEIENAKGPEDMFVAVECGPDLQERTSRHPDIFVTDYLQKLGCPVNVADHVADGVTKFRNDHCIRAIGMVYIAGPMRGHPHFNFPQFDSTRDFFAQQGYSVISPADIDRAAGLSEQDQTVYVFRDFWALYFLAKNNYFGTNGIVMLPGWTKSVGATGEFFLARWLGLKFYYCDGREAKVGNLMHDFALTHATLKGN